MHGVSFCSFSLWFGIFDGYILLWQLHLIYALNLNWTLKFYWNTNYVYILTIIWCFAMKNREENWAIKKWESQLKMEISKGQLNSEWIYEVIIFPKVQTKKCKDICPTKQTRIIAKKTACTYQKISKKKCYDPCLYGRTEILVIFGLHFGRNEDLINSFWI